jgi:hypothetical protein
MSLHFPQRKYSEHTHDDMPVGTLVAIMNPCVDFTCFKPGETGMVVRNTGKYLGVEVRLDQPYYLQHHDGGKHFVTSHWFNPTDLQVLAREQLPYPDEWESTPEELWM